MRTPPALFAAWLASCAPAADDPDPPDHEIGATGDTAIGPGGPVVCADPGLRAERAFDSVIIPGEASVERRFWGGGIVAGDFDGDGDIDLLAPGPDTARYLRNDAGAFVDDPTVLPALDYSLAAGGAAADFDADGDLDVVVTRWGPPDLLLENVGGRFALSDALATVDGHSQSATWGDADLDGDLDLLVAGHGQVEGGEQLVITGPGDPSRLWLGDGAGSLTEATERLGPVVDAYTFVIGLADLDGAGGPDLVVANDYPSWAPGVAALATGESWVVAPPDVGLTVHGAGMGLGIGDVNGDGWEDFLQPIWNALVYRQSIALGRWADATAASGLTVPAHTGRAWVGWGAELVDLDLDGDLDAVVAFGRLDVIAEEAVGGGSIDNEELQHYGIYLQHEGVFTESAAALSLDQTGAWRGFAVADLNGDGWPDLARRDLSGPIVLDLSRCGDAAWLRVVPSPPARAVGAIVSVTAGSFVWRRTIRAGGASLNSSGPPEAMIGLGTLAQVDRVEVSWPDGTVTVSEGPIDTRQVLVIAP